MSSNSLIINSAYKEPIKHWDADESGQVCGPKKGRRPAQYKLRKNNSFETYEFKIANFLREKIRSWRKNNYKGVTQETAKLLNHWQADNRQYQKFFFCQLEAVETIIYLTETEEGRQYAQEKVKNDGGQFPRWCAKMATGTGKTVAMAMLIAWHTINKVADPSSTFHHLNFLIVAPGLTVKDRLKDLYPHYKDNCYDEFLIVPHEYNDHLQSARILIVNWHRLDWQTAEQLAKIKGVVKKGEISDKAWVKKLFGNQLPEDESVVVINDEAHHAWRVPADANDKDFNKTTLEETKWIQGLDRLNNVKDIGIEICYDFTATPYIPPGKKTSERMFSWIVSDFGLDDAIESGLVKIPRRPYIKDNNFSSNKLDTDDVFHIFANEEVRQDLASNLKKAENERLPKLVIDAYKLLVSHWKQTFDNSEEQSNEGYFVLPVMVSITNKIDTAGRVKYLFTKSGILNTPQLADIDKTLHIDSSSLKKAESESDGTNKTAEELREQVRTVGVRNTPGEQIRHVIAVDMLSEGWDAKNITHIMGLRAFTSQLLCEQVIGRGLRRIDYGNINEKTGLFEPESVRIFGVPLHFMLQAQDDDKTTSVISKLPFQVLVEPTKSLYEICFPDIERINILNQSDLKIDINDIPQLFLKPSLSRVDMADQLGDKLKPTEEQIQDTTWNKRLQTLAMKEALYVSGSHSQSRQNNLWAHQLADLACQFAVQPHKIVATSSEDTLEILAKKHISEIVEHIANWISEQDINIASSSEFIPIYKDVRKPVRSTRQMKPWTTRTPKELLLHDPQRCHLNLGVFQSNLEKQIAQILDEHPKVAAWVKNDQQHIGFTIRYVHKGSIKTYVPDFIVKLVDGTHLIIEAKGQKEDTADSKQNYLNRWIKAVNSDPIKQFSKWENYGLVFYEDIPKLIHRLNMSG